MAFLVWLIVANDAPAQTAKFQSIWWDAAVDSDGDGYKQSAQLGWRVRGSGMNPFGIFYQIYRKPASSSSWTLVYTSPVHELDLDFGEFGQYDVSGLSHNLYDWKIQVRLAGGYLCDEVDPSMEPALNDCAFESASEDGGGTTARATVYDAWWTNKVDLDGDGFRQSARLFWDVDVSGSGSLTVFEKVYYKPSTSSTWTLYRTCPAHVINGTAWDSVYVDVSNLPHALYDWRIEAYRSGQGSADHARDPSNDSDLNDYALETTAEDTVVASTATIYDAWWSNGVDGDGDGYKCSARLNWDPNVVGSGSLTVYEKIYYKLSTSSAWTVFWTNSTHTITGVATADQQHLSIDGGGHNLYDWKIEVYRSGQGSADYTRDPSNDSDLNDYAMETVAQDTAVTVKATIYNAWWTNKVDLDGDGFRRSARLFWDVDVSGSGSLTVFEKVYYKLSTSSTWTLYRTSPAHVINGSAWDSVYIDVLNLPHGLYDWRIETYRSGQSLSDDTYDAAEDPDLNDFALETATEDAPAIVTITSPTSGQQVRTNNGQWLVKGTASDNAGVVQVLVSQNNTGWQPATGTTAWQSLMNLQAGPNTVAAYAVTAAGNRSLTNTVSFTYVLMAPIGLKIVGKGTVSGATNGQQLEIGRQVVLTAKPGAGHVLTNWLVQVRGATVLSTNRAVPFGMQSNLVLTATFADVTKPVLTITSPTPNQRWSNAVFTVKGKVTDNGPMGSVACQLNGGAWNPAQTLSNGTNWTTDVTLSAGTNVVKVLAEDAAGNRSPTSSVKLVYVVSDRLCVTATGPCILSPNYSNALLEIGKSCSLTATSGKGFVFSNWVGSVLGNVVIVTNTPQLTFIMQSNFCVQANIIPDPFIPLAGSYYGLVYDLTNGVQQASAGFFSGTLGTGGSLSGKLQMGGRSDSFTGQFDVGRRLRKTVTRTGSTPLGLDLQLASDGTLSGTVSNVAWTSTLEAYRAVFDAATNPCPYAGRYALAIPGEEGEPGYPEGIGCGLVTVDKAGNAVMSGTLAEGTVMSQSVPISKEGDWPLYLSLYGGKGSFMAWLKFTLPGGLTNTLASWIKPTNSASAYYRGGFTNVFEMAGSSYLYVNTNRVLALTNGVMVFSGGNLTVPVTNKLLLTATNGFLNQGTNPMALTVNVTNGYLSGWFKVPGLGKTNQFKGVLLQQQIRGEGYFLGTNQSGGVILRPQ